MILEEYNYWRGEGEEHPELRECPMPWLKNFTTLHERIADQLQVCLELAWGEPQAGRALLILKVLQRKTYQASADR